MPVTKTQVEAVLKLSQVGLTFTHIRLLNDRQRREIALVADFYEGCIAGGTMDREEAFSVLALDAVANQRGLDAETNLGEHARAARLAEATTTTERARIKNVPGIPA